MLEQKYGIINVFDDSSSVSSIMRSNDEYREILRLWESGLNKSAITRETGIPRTTVRECITKFGTLQKLEDYLIQNQKYHWTRRRHLRNFRFNYAYMLGIYLGDGYIATHPRTYRLRVVLDKKYPDIIQRVKESMQVLVPNNSIHTVNKIGCIEVACYCSDWVEMFPQHGEGVKHTREIVLEDWQEEIVDEHLIEFVRGLYHSDGSRTVPYQGTENEKSPRYYFTNFSQDIQQIFCDAVEKLGLYWAKWGKNICINRKADTAFLDKHIGAKS